MVLLALVLGVVLPARLSPPRETVQSLAPLVDKQHAAQDVSARPVPVAKLAGPGASTPLAPLNAVVRPLSAGESEVCGLGTVRVDDDSPLAQQRIPEGVRALALQRLGMAMATSRNERMRAAEKLLRARLTVAEGAMAAAVEADAACRKAREFGLEETARHCTEEQARAQADLLDAASPTINELARLAVLTNDAQVYAFAIGACVPVGLSLYQAGGNCQLVSAEQWAWLAPDNAEPWLQLAAQAIKRGDEAAVSAWLARAAQAATIGSNTGALAAMAVTALPDDMPLLEQTAALMDIAAVERSSASSGLDTLDTACSEPALHEAERRAACEALATMLVERGRSSAAVTAGAQLGERLGWPAARTSAILREQREALDAALRFTAATQSLACDSQQRQRELILLTGRLGDVGAGRELMRREHRNLQSKAPEAHTGAVEGPGGHQAWTAMPSVQLRSRRVQDGDR